MADVSILDTSVKSVPKDYKITGAQEIVLKGVTASFDGSGAATTFVPAFQVVDPSGFIVGTYTIGTIIAAGASADVSWFPGVNSPGSGLGTGIQFDTDNEGGWLDVTTNNTDPGGWGTHFKDTTFGGILIETNGGGLVELLSNGGIDALDSSSTGIDINTSGTGGIVIEDSGNPGGGVKIQADAHANGIGVFNTNANGIFVQDSGAGGIFLDENSTGQILVQNEGNAGGGILLQNTHADNGTVKILGTSNSDANPRLEVRSPISNTGDNIFIGDDARSILFSHGVSPHIQVNGGNLSENARLAYNIILDGGSGATHYNNAGTRVVPTLIMGSTDVEPNGSVLGSDTYTCVLYIYNDGSGHPKLKMFCPLTNTYSTIATG